MKSARRRDLRAAPPGNGSLAAHQHRNVALAKRDQWQAAERMRDLWRGRGGRSAGAFPPSRSQLVSRRKVRIGTIENPQRPKQAVNKLKPTVDIGLSGSWLRDSNSRPEGRWAEMRRRKPPPDIVAPTSVAENVGCCHAPSELPVAVVAHLALLGEARAPELRVDKAYLPLRRARAAL